MSVWVAEQHFPGAIQIVDLYHARQHIWELAAKLFPVDERARKRWAAVCVAKLDAGNIEALATILRSLRPDNDKLAADVLHDADYFARNAERMRYPQFRAQGLFVGSGVVEAGCAGPSSASVRNARACSGPFAAPTPFALRCCRLSRRFEDHWESRSRAA